MSDLLDLEVPGDPAACRTAAADAGRVRSAVATAESDVRRAVSTVAAWQGLAADGFEARTSRSGRDLRELDDRLRGLERALEDFAGELATVQARMAEARRVAVAGGVTVSGSSLVRPQAAEGLTPAQADAHEAKVRAWNEAVEIAEGARTKEREAHQQLGDGVKASTGDGFVTDLLQRLGLLPPDFADGDDLGAWIFGLGGLGSGAGVGWMVNGRLGVFQPRVGGRFGTAAGMDFWQRVRAAADPDSFHAKAHQAASRNRWTTAGTWANRVGGLVTAASAGWNQWQADADDPSMGGAERGARSATMAATTTVGAVAGAKGGAWVGGAIGGFVGSEVGQQVIDEVGDLAEDASDWAGDRLDDAGDMLSDAGDTLTFWD